jgi:hemolysin activation/secretion protein
VNALWGVRSVRFLRVTGFEALTGAQDVRRGFQLGTMVGRSLGLLGSHDDDVFVSGDLYIGAGSERSFGALELRGEGRQDNDRNEWNAMVGSGRGAWYVVPDDRQRVLVDVQYSGAWRPRIPVQFALGARDGGARGFRDTELAGAGRVVARLEHRMVFGRPFNLGDIGMATFSDVGRIWAGDAPYGVTTPVRASLGVGLLAAVPPRSRRLWRVDLAYPLTKEAGSGLQLSFSNRDMTRQFWREPRDVQLSRTRAVPSSVFTWP